MRDIPCDCLKPVKSVNLKGLNLTGCLLCTTVTDCYFASGSGYSSCATCGASTGQADRDCAVALLPAYRDAIDENGRAPAFSVLGPVSITGRIVDFRTKKSVANGKFVIQFPNGLAVSTKTDTRGRFRLKIESTENGKLEKVDLGTLPHKGGKSKPLAIGFTLKGVTPRHTIEPGAKK